MTEWNKQSLGNYYPCDFNNWFFLSAQVIDLEKFSEQNVYSTPDLMTKSERVKSTTTNYSNVWVRFDDGSEREISFNQHVSLREGQHVIIAYLKNINEEAGYPIYMYVKESNYFITIDKERVSKHFQNGCIFNYFIGIAIGLALSMSYYNFIGHSFMISASIFLICVIGIAFYRNTQLADLINKHEKLAFTHMKDLSNSL